MEYGIILMVLFIQSYMVVIWVECLVCNHKKIKRIFSLFVLGVVVKIHIKYTQGILVITEETVGHGSRIHCLRAAQGSNERGQEPPVLEATSCKGEKCCVLFCAVFCFVYFFGLFFCFKSHFQAFIDGIWFRIDKNMLFRKYILCF